ncbi:MAG: hypothetical protein ACYCUM_03310 [Solirubrobacteraceae bacterium]
MSADAGDGTADVLASANGAGASAAPEPADLAASSPPMRPELAVGAAFAGGLLLAMLFRRVRS